MCAPVNLQHVRNCVMSIGMRQALGRRHMLVSGRKLGSSLVVCVQRLDHVMSDYESRVLVKYRNIFRHSVLITSCG